MSITLLALTLHLMTTVSALPVGDDPSEDFLQASHIKLQDLAEVAMSPNKSIFEVIQLQSSSEPEADTIAKLEETNEKDVQTILFPLSEKEKAKAIGGAIPAAAAIKGSVVGSAIATPIILKSVALPGIAAGKTAAFLALPHAILTNAQTLTQAMTDNVKNSIQDHSVHFTELLLNKDLLNAEEEPDEETPLVSFDIQNGLDQAVQKVALLKAGALNAATKGVLLAKKGAYVAGRIILKPIAIVTGIHLKMIGSGLAFGGKLVGGTGAGIAKAGTAVKYTGLGAIGLGASAVSWGLDKSTIDTHLEAEAEHKLN